MFKGFFAGLAGGVALSAVMVIVANELAVRYDLTDKPQAAEVELPAGSAFDAVRSDLPPQVPGSDGSAPSETAPAGVPDAATPEAMPAGASADSGPMTPVAGAVPPDAVRMSEDGAAEAASLATQPRPDGGRPQTGPALALTADTPDVVPAPVAPVAGPVSSPNVGDAAAAPTAPDDTAAPVMLGQGSDAPAGTALTGDEAGLIAGQVISGGAFSGIAPDELPASPLSGVRPVVPVEIDPLAIPEADSAVALPGRGVPAVAPDAPDAPAAPEAGAEPDAARAEPAAPAPLEDSSASAGETRDQAVLIPTDRLPQAGRAEAAPGRRPIRTPPPRSPWPRMP